MSGGSAGRRFGGGARTVLLAVLLAGLTACASDEEEAYRDRPVEELYNSALDELAGGNPTEAAKGFDEVERQHPYSVWARKSQIMAAYSHYLANRYNEAILAGERFLQLHPGNRDAPYVSYLIALCYYEQIADVGRDQKITRQAMESLQTVVDRFPNTDYARDARLKIDLARDHLAGKEMEVGRYYLTRGNFAGAINRFGAVIERYQTTSHVPEALYRLTEAYLALGVKEEAQAMAAVLGFNYPGTQWYAESYALLTGQGLEPQEAQGSWISRVWKNLL